MPELSIFHTSPHEELAHGLQAALAEVGYHASVVALPSKETLSEVIQTEHLDPFHIARIILLDAATDVNDAKTKPLDTRKIFVSAQPHTLLARHGHVSFADWNGATDAPAFRDLLDILNAICIATPGLAPPKAPAPLGIDDVYPAPAPAPAEFPPLAASRTNTAKTKNAPKSRVIGFRVLPVLTIAALLGAIFYALTT